jgi:hypothetical protein
MTHLPRRALARLAAVLLALNLTLLSGCADDAPDDGIPREPFPRLEEPDKTTRTST